jgi:hypothetical protein
MWPFAVWGLDLSGPFKKALGDFTDLPVMAYKFTKWIEASSLVEIGSKQAVSFV